MEDKIKHVKEIKDIQFYREVNSKELDDVSEAVYYLKTSGIDIDYIDFIEVPDVYTN